MVRRAAVAAACALALSACAMTNAHRQPPSAAERGHATARRACAACHAVEPGLDSPRPPAPPFASREMRHTAGLDGRVADIAHAGHYNMPAIPLSPGEAADLVAYIEGLRSRSDDAGDR